MKWIAAFSQSGGEICDLIDRGFRPDLIVTNNLDSTKWDIRLFLDHRIPIFLCKNRVILWDRIRNFKPEIVTLHGYLQIVPAEYVKDLKIINGHPGDVVLYPELVGKDPQKKAIDLNLSTTGVVIHEVTEVVDHGLILGYKQHDIKEGTTTEQLIKQLKEVQLELWVEVLEGLQ